MTGGTMEQGCLKKSQKGFVYSDYVNKNIFDF